MPKSVQSLRPDEAMVTRKRYLDVFINTESEYYQKNIATLQNFRDGQHYIGYLWDCIRDGRRVTFERLREKVSVHPTVYVLADDHSRDRVINDPLWPYPPYSVISLPPTLLIQLLHALQRDLYVFDSTFGWTLIMTHEHDTKRRICIAAGDVAMT
jgi:hypothetical protein